MLTIVSQDGKEFTLTEEEARASGKLSTYFHAQPVEFSDCRAMRTTLPFSHQVCSTIVRYLQLKHKAAAATNNTSELEAFEVDPKILVEVASAARYLLC